MNANANVKNPVTGNDTSRKNLTTAATAIGSAVSAADKFATLCQLRDAAADKSVLNALYTAATTAHKSAVSSKALAAAGVNPDTASRYMLAVANCYNAAARYADVVGTPAAAPAENVLFTAWKDVLSTVSDSKKVRATAVDSAQLYAAVTGVCKAGRSYQSYVRTDGTVSARMVTGTASAAIVSPTAFQKRLEILVVDRIAGFDGVMSRDTVKAVQESNTSMRDAAVSLAATGAELDTAASKDTASADKSSKSSKGKSSKSSTGKAGKDTAPSETAAA